MPIKIQNNLPAREQLEKENIFVVDEDRAMHQDIRPLSICILNLMPLKEDTELQLLRALSNTPLQIDVTFMRVSSHEAGHTSLTHLNSFYNTFDELKNNHYDGMIITGAPVEKMGFEEVDYWNELCKIFEWTKKNVTSTFHICWGAQAACYYHFGLQKVSLPQKLFGIYAHKVLNRKVPLIRGFDDVFYIPHSRYTTVPIEDIHKCNKLIVLAQSYEAGAMLCMTKDGKQIFSFGHAEYDRMTLDNEYRRDIGKGLGTPMPRNYYPDDNPANKPRLTWRAHCNLLYSNWLNYFVYQITPYDIESIHFLTSLQEIWKIPSGEITNFPYLVEIAKTGKEIFLSTGMCTMDEVDAAIDVLRDNGVGSITLLHCTTNYPTPMRDVNLKAMLALEEHCGCPIGYSDHTQGTEVPIAAVAMGASVIEKHFTLDRNMEGPDHKASLEPDEFKAMVKAIRNIESALGDGIKRPSESEKANIAVARKSIIALDDIKVGEIFSEKNITTKRPGTGISPMRWNEIIGTKAKRDFEKDELIEV